jgi:hypothetical protein
MIISSVPLFDNLQRISFEDPCEDVVNVSDCRWENSPSGGPRSIQSSGDGYPAPLALLG